MAPLLAHGKKASREGAGNRRVTHMGHQHIDWWRRRTTGLRCPSARATQYVHDEPRAGRRASAQREADARELLAVTIRAGGCVRVQRWCVSI